MTRLFVAVRPPGELLDAIGSLGMEPAPGVRWVPRDQMHVTLRFLGDAPIDEVDHLLGGLELPVVTAQVGPKVTRLGHNIVCLAVGGLEETARAVTVATAGIGDPPDARGFKGHLTLARLRDRVRCALVGSAFDARWQVDSMELVSSTLDNTGAHHRVEATYPLITRP